MARPLATSDTLSTQTKMRNQLRHDQQGFAYLLLIFALATIGVVLAGAGQSWRHAGQRDKETELLFIGKEFSRALTSYRDQSPKGTPTAPESLDDLVEDHRFPNAVRHLRRVYRDPMTGQSDWALIIAGGRIVGIHSQSTKKPLRQELPQELRHSAGQSPAQSYTNWVFSAPPPNSIPPR